MITKLSDIGHSIRLAGETLNVNSGDLLKRIGDLKDKVQGIHGNIRWANEQIEMEVEIAHLERQLAVNGNY